ncbi:MAG: NUDIX domain-containing protein [Patescibacteria group bacterium]
MKNGSSKKPLAPAHLRFAVIAVDATLFTVHKGTLMVRLIRVNHPPLFVHTPGLPGGLITPEETAEQAAQRMIKAKAKISINSIYIEQLYTFSSVERDPRGRVVAVAYIGLVPWDALRNEEQLDTPEAFWSPVTTKEKLAYDHTEMLKVALTRLRSRITYTTLIQKLLPKEFTLTELEDMYKTILGTHLDKRNFRKKILKLKVLTPLSRTRSGGKFRPAQLYAFSSTAVKEIEIL